MKTICVRHSGKTRFDPQNGCWPVRLWLANNVSLTQIQNYSSKRHIRQLRIIKFGRFWLMVIVIVGAMVKISVMVGVRVSVRSIVRVS